MTFRIRISDPTCPDTRKVIESAVRFAEAEDNPLKALAELHDNPTEAEFDLDDPEDRERFEEIFGEELMVRVEHLEEGEELTFECVERVDEWADEEDPEPVPAPGIRADDCCICETKPDLIHDALGFRFRCPVCGNEMPPQRTLKEAVAAWNGEGITTTRVPVQPVPCRACGVSPTLVSSPEGYRYLCLKCKITTVPHATPRMAAKAWEAVQW